MAGPKGSQKLAVLLCKFKDTASTEPQPRQFFEDLFANANTGGLNDYWRSASLGAINLDGTQVLGWNTIDQDREDYIATHPDRWSKILGAFPSFPGFRAEDFAGVIAVFNSDVRDGGFHNGVLVNVDAYNVTFLGHETGHLFGLQHSFDESDRKNADWSAPGEYFDPYDIMSAMAVSAAPSQKFGIAGPLACVAHLDRMGWLNPARTWTPATVGSDTEFVDIVSLQHPEIPGYLGAKIGGLFVEFRTKDGFDSGIGQATILIHRLSGDSPVVMATNKTTWDFHWLPGMTFGATDIELLLEGGVQVRIESFDLPGKKARIRIRIVAAPLHVAGPVGMLGGVARDGGGFVILPSGKIIRIPPRSPALDLASAMALLVEAERVLEPVTFGRTGGTTLADVARLLQPVGLKRPGRSKEPGK